MLFGRVLWPKMMNSADDIDAEEDAYADLAADLLTHNHSGYAEFGEPGNEASDAKA